MRLKDFCQKKLLLSQASKLTAGNLGEHCKPLDEFQWVEGGVPEKLRINVS